MKFIATQLKLEFERVNNDIVVHANSLYHFCKTVSVS